MASHDRLRGQLRTACLAGDQKQVESLLRLQGTPWRERLGSLCFRGPSSAAQPDPQAELRILSAPFPGDGGNTLLHYVLAGSPLGSLGRLLWLSSGGSLLGEVQPGRHGSERAQLLAWLLARQPALLALLCVRNAGGLTPLHCCLRSASLEALRVLMGALRLLSPPALRVLLAVPAPGGQTALGLALQSQQWEAVELLVAAGGHLLCHEYLAAAQQVALVVNPAAVSRPSRLGGKGGAAAAAGVSFTRAVTGAFKRGLGQLLDLVAGQAAAEQLAQQAQQVQQGGGSSGGGGAAAGGSGNCGRRGPCLPPREVAPAAPGAGSKEEVVVLQGTADVQRLREGQINSTAYVLGISKPEAAALLAEHGWDELAAVQSRLGPGSSSSPREGQPNGSAPAAPGAASADGQAAGAGSGASGGAPAAEAAGPCIVCFEECSSSRAWWGLPCGHPTCDACWHGILRAQLDTGEVHRVACPQPGCGMPLPLEAAQPLLPAAEYGRYQQLLAQSYVAANPSLRWCPRPGCGNVVRLVGADGGGPAPRDAAAAGRGVTVQCACGHAFCWACSADGHEPATCEQMRRWGEELAALRAAAPNQDQQWLARNTKRCPACAAPIQKQGGCNHMTCRSCRHQWCWECGRDWSQHTAETGGFYHCVLARRPDLPDFEQPPSSSSRGALGWLQEAWSMFQTMTAQRALEQHLRDFLRHDFNPAQLATLAAHTQRLLQAAGVDAGAPPGGSRAQADCPPAALSGSADGQRNGPIAASDSKAVRSLADGGGGGEREGEEFGFGPSSLLGLTLGEAAGMAPAEWGHLVAAAAESLAESGQLLASPPAAAAAAAAVTGRDAAQGPAATASAAALAADLECLPQALAAAHAVLQHAAVVAWALGGYGPRRRYLARLCEGVEARLGGLEGLLLGMPDRDAAQQCQQRLKPPSAWAAGRQPVTSLVARVLHSLYGVTPPHLQLSKQASHQPQQPDQRQQWLQNCLSRGLGSEQLRQQLLFALALREQERGLHAELAALEAGVGELRQAGRAGLFSGS